MILWASVRRNRRLVGNAVIASFAGAGVVTEPITHPLAKAAAKAGRATDAVLGAARQGQRIDRRLLMLREIESTGAAARAELIATRLALGAYAGMQEAGAFGAYWSWYRDGISVLQREATRLGFAPADLELRGSAWEMGRG